MIKREQWIDSLRAFACIMVLFCHAPQPFHNQPGQWLMGVNNYYGMAWGPILFFMISGACLLGRDVSAIDFLKRRLSRILVPTIIWSVIYIVLEALVWHTTSVEGLWRRLLCIPFAPQYGLMWYMYALLAIYLVTPILSRWLINAQKKEVKLYLCLWGVTLLLPYIDIIGVDISNVENKTGVLYYLSGFLWVAVLGYYCRTYVRINHWRWWHTAVAILIVLSPALPFFIKHYTGEVISSSLTINSMATTALAFVIFQQYAIKVRGGHLRFIINTVSQYSFGIYLSHMVLMYPFCHWIAQFKIHYALQIPLTVIIVGFGSFVISYCLNKLPFGKYLIG